MASSLRASNLYGLHRQVALVTGGGTGIGFMIAQGLAANGARVYITGRRKEVLDKVVGAWKSEGEGALIALPMDVTDKESILTGRNLIEQKEGKLHVLVNNAGQVGPTIGPWFNDKSAKPHSSPAALGQAMFDNESFEDWSSLYKINTFATYFVTTAFLGLLDKGTEDLKQRGYWASVVNVTSISGITKLAQEHFCYNSAKAAASHLTKMMSTEFALKGIHVRVNSVAPGVYSSEMTFDTISGPEETNNIGKGVQPVPGERAGTAEEMVGTVLYLASRAGGYVHGQEIIIDGGYLSVNP